MAKLPTVETLGARPSPQPGTAVSGYQATSGQEEAPALAQARFGQGMEASGQQLASTMLEEQHKQDTLRAEDAFNKLRQSQLALSVGDDGFMRKKGADAATQPIFTDYTAKINQARGDIASTLANDRQRELFKARADVGVMQFQHDLLTHVTQENNVYAKQVYTGTLTTELQNAVAHWQDASPTGAVALSIARTDAAIATEAKREGWAPEAAAAERDTALSKIHAGVINQALASGNYTYAAKYYEVNKNGINAQTAAAIQTAFLPVNAKLMADAAMTDVDQYQRDLLAPPTTAGQRNAPIEVGNIDLHKRPIVKNADGSISTVRSMSFNDAGKEVLIPTVVGGKVVSDNAAIDHYRKTGEHLGKFDTPASATAYAEQLHQDQAREYVPQAGRSDQLFNGIIAAERSGTHDISPKFAYGRAQVLEPTGRAMAAKLGIPFDLNKFRDDDQYNMTLGKAYLDEQLQNFGGNPTLAYAAYNAGPARVTEWIKKFGDPRTGAISDADWAARIPFKETRDYVPRALAAAGPEVMVGPTPSMGVVAGVIPVTLGNQNVPMRMRDTRAQLGSWLANGERMAQEKYPDNPVMRDLVIQNIKGRAATIVAAQEGVQRQAQGVLLQAAIGMNNTPPPTTAQELFQIPGAREAFVVMDEAAQRGMLVLLDQNARHANGENVRSNKVVLDELFRRVHVDENDPNKIRSSTQLAPFFNKGLNRTDYDWLKKEIDTARTPEGNSFLRDVQNVRRNADKQMRAGMMGRILADTQPEKLEEASYAFNLDLDKKIDEMRKAGKDPRALLTPGTPDYVLTPGRVASYLQTPSAALADGADKVRAGQTTPTAAPAKPVAAVRVKDDADYNKLVKGARYIGPDGVERYK